MVAGAFAAVAVAVPTGLTGAVAPPVAVAHDSVINSKPEDGGTVAEFPREIVLEFSGIPKPNFNTVAVSNADTREVLFSVEPILDQQFVHVDVPADIDPGPGNYLVGFQITSSDGHATRGGVTFSVAVKPEDVTTDGEFHDNTPASGDSSGPSLGLVVGCIAIVGILAAVVFLYVKRK
ncbi:copper resistance protein CopC [Corynebacterium sp. CCM 8862]|uniref:Copper resistance protein CopC n=1 Tax=Corynebacterium mendelii TaxID=2765362 RepID=A0A939E0M0_9CORY|nr:copper resistance protein CopC [Corynebacterium mendelii]